VSSSISLLFVTLLSSGGPGDVFSNISSGSAPPRPSALAPPHSFCLFVVCVCVSCVCLWFFLGCSCSHFFFSLSFHSPPVFQSYYFSILMID
jgi:hypothetical protein